MRKPSVPGWENRRGLGGALETMSRCVRRAPSRKRKSEGRAEGSWEYTAVNSFYRAVQLPSVCGSLRLREMVRSGSRPGQVRAADLRRPLWGWRRNQGDLGLGGVQNSEKQTNKKQRLCGRVKNAGKGEWGGGGVTPNLSILTQPLCP